MRCPTCNKMYDDSSLRYCLADGTQLQPTHPGVDREAPTLALTNDEQAEADAQLETRHTLVMQAVIRLLGGEWMAFDEIMQLAPKVMTEAQVLRAVDKLVENGYLRRSKLKGIAIYSYNPETSISYNPETTWYEYEIIIGDGTIATTLDAFITFLRDRTNFFYSMKDEKGGKFRLYLTAPEGIHKIEAAAKASGVVRPIVKYYGPTHQIP